MSDVFIKAPPEVAQIALQADNNADLCSVMEYDKQFKRPSPATISQRVKEFLVASGFVPQHVFAGDKNTAQ